MRIFIFRPHKDWDYMGGGLVVIAKKWEDIHDIVIPFLAGQLSWMKDYPKQLEDVKDTKFIWEREEEDTERDYDDIWVCVASFALKENQGTFVDCPKPHVVMYNFNDG